MDNNTIFELIRTTELLNDESMLKFTKSFEYNVGISQILVLDELAQKGAQMQSVLAKELDYTPGAMTNIANKLINEGYAERKYSDSDRRKVLLSITDKGLDVLKKAEQRGQEMRKEMYSVLTDEEVEQLLSINKKLLAYLRKE